MTSNILAPGWMQNCGLNRMTTGWGRSCSSALCWIRTLHDCASVSSRLIGPDGDRTDTRHDHFVGVGNMVWSLRARRRLLKFVSPGLRKAVGILKAHNKSDLLDHIKWASTAAVRSSSKSYVDESVRGEASTQIQSNVVLGPPPAPHITNSSDVF